jgi:hypothetical protein
VSSGAEPKKALRDGSSSLCWFWPLLIIYTCALCRPAVCRDRAEDQGKMKTRIVQPWTPEDDDRLRKLAAEGRTAWTISERMKRSPQSIRNRARALKIVLAKVQGSFRE